MIDDIPRDLRAWARVKYVRTYFKYDPTTGDIYRRTDNKQVGYIHHGYIRVSTPDFEIYAHQVAFAIMRGSIPFEVDHRDKNKSNNLWSNLRAVNNTSKNKANVFKRSTNKSGLKGVSWSKSNKCWRMDIAFLKVKYHSYHATKEEAYSVYCEMSAKLHKEFGYVE